MVSKQCKPSLRACHATLPFLFISNDHHSYQMPTLKSSSAFRCFSAERTHPIDDIESSPLFVLFGNRKKHWLHHEGAEIFDLNKVGAVHESSSPVPAIEQSPATPRFVYNGTWAPSIFRAVRFDDSTETNRNNPLPSTLSHLHLSSKWKQRYRSQVFSHQCHRYLRKAQSHSNFWVWPMNFQVKPKALEKDKLLFRSLQHYSQGTWGILHSMHALEKLCNSCNAGWASMPSPPCWRPTRPTGRTGRHVCQPLLSPRCHWRG